MTVAPEPSPCGEDRRQSIRSHSGSGSPTTGSDNIDVGNTGKAGEAGTIRIGTNGTQTATDIAGISGTPLGGAAQPVVVKSNGQLGTAPAASASTASLAATVERLQRQVDRLRQQVQRGG